MNKLFTAIITIIAAILAFRMHILLGIVFVLAALIYIYYSNYSSFMAGRANAIYNNGDKEKALSYYEKAIKKGRTPYSTLTGYANMLLRCGKPEEALTQINRVLSTIGLAPDTKKQAKQIRSLINYKLGEIDEALEEALELYESGYTTSIMRSLVGLLMHTAKKPADEILKFCEEAYDYDSDSRDIADNYLLALIGANKLSEAKEVSEKLIEAQPEFAEGYYHSAMLYKELGEKVRAKELLNKYPECKVTYMTTVSEKDFEDLKASL